MIGPIVLVVVSIAAGAASGGWPGAVAVGFGGLMVVAAMAAGAALWARRIGSLLEPEDAWEHAPRPPGFRPMMDWVYRRTLEMETPQE